MALNDFKDTNQDGGVLTVSNSNMGKGIKWNPNTKQYEVNIGDGLEINEQGQVAAKKIVSTIRIYTGVYGGNTIGSSNDETGRRLILSDNLGIIHLDFQRASTSGIVITLPPEAPTPISKLEVQTSDGAIVYIDAGTRTVRCSNVSANRRCIADLIGFFQ